MRRPTPAMLVALLALFVALGGTATATVQRLITSRDIKNGTIRLVDLAPATKKALQGQVGPAGPAGPVGPQGPAGPQGAAGTFGAVTSVAGPPEVISPLSVETSTANCPPNTVVVGGGWESVGSASVDNSVTKSEATGNGWVITLVNFSYSSPFNWHATAMCASH